ncbi:HAD-IB family phosphatase [Pontibacter sp. 13R65]|uniref:HAD-IB family phosphatase n=1 Tax=Pontibacter sp. 13R65 TaxID=3127458 RepID=UPI00301BB020
MAAQGNEENTVKEEIDVVVFDLNGTFYNKSSKDEFFKFVSTKKPKQSKHIFQMAYYQLLHKLNQINKTEFKENFFNYLDDLPPKQVEQYAQEFWEQEFPVNFNKELQKRLDDMKKKGIKIICATGALELYVKPLLQLYKIDGLVGTRVQYEVNTYKVLGQACKDEEKLNRISSLLNGRKYNILEAYSDSKEAILDKAHKAYLVEDGKISPYKQNS